MSSCGNPETESAALMPRRLKFDKSRTCVKCKSNPGNLVIRHAVYCKECFYPLVTTKFKRILEPTVNPVGDHVRKKALRAEGDLLLAFSAGPGSTVLLDLVSRCYFSAIDEGDENPRGGKHHPRNGNVWKRVWVCYVEVCNAFPGVRDRSDDVRAVVDNYPGFELIQLRIEDAFDKSWWARVSGSRSFPALALHSAEEDLIVSTSRTLEDANPVDSLRSYILSLPTQTAIASTIQMLTRVILLYTASSTRCSHILLGTSLTSLSVALVSSISQGGGFTVREEIEEQWTQPSNESAVAAQEKMNSRRRCVRIVRPLREIGMKECAMWAWWNGLKVVGREALPGMNQAIAALTKSFIFGLERNYPSTVSAIVRTCGKLAPKEKSSALCALCQRPVPPGVQGWKAQISIKSLSPAEDQTASQTTEPRSLARHLCYPCHTTLTSRSSRGAPFTSKTSTRAVGEWPVPIWVQDAFRGSLLDKENVQDLKDEHEGRFAEKMDSIEMKAAISDYLLD